MKLAVWKRTMLAGLMALTVAGGSLATFTAGNASANGGSIPDHSTCYGWKTPSGKACSIN